VLAILKHNVYYVGMKTNNQIELHDDARLIDAIGGVAKVAMTLGYSKERVNNWRYRGIPARVILDKPRLWSKARRLVKNDYDIFVL